MLHLTLRQLQVFESAARHLSLSRAAEELHLSQPGVSMQMKKLTEAVGQPLMEQNGKRVQLTDQGQELVAASREILGALKRFELSLVARQGLTKGSLRLVAISTATYFVPRLLGEFAQLHPGVKVSLRVTNREQVLETLAAGLEDLYILGQPPEGLAVTAIPFMDNPLVVLAAPDHPLAHKKHISLARLAEEPWLLREPGSGTRKAVERIFAENGLIPHAAHGTGQQRGHQTGRAHRAGHLRPVAPHPGPARSGPVRPARRARLPHHPPVVRGVSRRAPAHGGGAYLPGFPAFSWNPQ
jgi:DNA-binding transcriptional LysR family regulator